MIARVARIEMHSSPRVTSAEVKGSLLGDAPVARVLWELPAPHETSWLVQVPEELAIDQLRRFTHLRIAADVVGFRSVDLPNMNGDHGPGIEPGLRPWSLSPAC
jgi:hypothetical protein